MFSRLARLATAAALLLESGAASAQTNPKGFSLQVERQQGAETCPALAWFSEQVALHTPSGQLMGSFLVRLSRSDRDYRAEIQLAGSARTVRRVIEDSGPSCEPLARAVALTLAMLAESTAREVAASQSSAGTERSPGSTTATGRATQPMRMWVAAGAGATGGWISPAAAAFGAGFALETERLRLSLRALLTSEQHFALPPGEIAVQGWLISLQACPRIARGRLEFALCGVFDAGLLRASAQGFEAAAPNRRAYAALGIEAMPGLLVLEGVRAAMHAGLLLPVQRESFSVTGRGRAYLPPAVNWRIMLLTELRVF